MGVKQSKLLCWLLLVMMIAVPLLAGCNRSATTPEESEEVTTSEEETTTEQVMPTPAPTTQPETSEAETETETTTEEVQPTESAPEATEPTPETAEATVEPGPAKATPEAPAVEQTYTVVANDTLFSIAQRYGVGVDELVAKNGLESPDRIEVGQSLVIPVAGAAETEPEPPAAEERVHVVQFGENLFRISLQYELSFETVAAYNGIPWPYSIYAGQEIKIPPAEAGN